MKCKNRSPFGWGQSAPETSPTTIANDNLRTKLANVPEMAITSECVFLILRKDHRCPHYQFKAAGRSIKDPTQLFVPNKIQSLRGYTMKLKNV